MAARHLSSASVIASASSSRVPIPSQCFCQLYISASALVGTGAGIAEPKSRIVSTYTS
jgi:hypothetical protein